MKYVIILFFSFFLASCQDDNDSINIDEKNEAEILEYIEKNNLDAQKTSSGLYYVIDNPGEGAQPNNTARVRVSYKGYFTNGKVFDQSSSAGISFGLQQVIAGWTEGITLFREGGSGKLIIPSRLGYGPDRYSSIPGGSVLIFDIVLLEVQ